MKCLSVAPCKGIQDLLGIWIPRRGFRIPDTGFQFFSFELRFLIPIVIGIPDSTSNNFPDSGFPYMWRYQ